LYEQGAVRVTDALDIVRIVRQRDLSTGILNYIFSNSRREMFFNSFRNNLDPDLNLSPGEHTSILRAKSGYPVASEFKIYDENEPDDLDKSVENLKFRQFLLGSSPDKKKYWLFKRMYEAHEH
jgi:hypothetical protein